MSYNEKNQSSLQGVVLQELPNARAVQMQGDSDVELASGPLRVLLVTVYVEDPFHDSKAAEKTKAADPASSDVWLVLEIGSGFSLPVKANQIIKPQRETSSYSIPSEDVPGASIQLFVPGSHGSDIDQFEDLLADYCAFQLDDKGKGTFELIDEKGHMLGTIDGPWTLQEDSRMYKPGFEKDPVMVELPDEGSKKYGSEKPITVSTAPRDEYGAIPASYQNDWLLKGASFVTKSMIGGSTWAGKKMVDAADSYVRKSSPLPGGSQDVSRTNSPGPGGNNLTTSGRQAVTFSPKVYATSGQLKAVSGTVTQISGRTRDAVLGVASKVGDQIGKKTGIQRLATPSGEVVEPKGLRGVVNRGLIAANMVLDGVTQSAETLIRDGGKASGSIIEHRYGSEAKVISGNTASIGRSAFVVYKDINGVRRKALLKIATGTIKARAPDGSEVVLQQEGDHMAPIAQPQSQTIHPSASGRASPLPPSYEKGGQMEKREQAPTALSASASAKDEESTTSSAAALPLADISVSDSSSSLFESVFLPSTPTSWARRHFHSDWPPLSSEWGRSPFHIHPDSPFVVPFEAASLALAVAAAEHGASTTGLVFTGKTEAGQERGRGRGRGRGESVGAPIVARSTPSGVDSVDTTSEEREGAQQREGDVLLQPLFSQYTHSASPHNTHDVFNDTGNDTVLFCSSPRSATDLAALALMGGDTGGRGFSNYCEMGYDQRAHHISEGPVYLVSSLKEEEQHLSRAALVSPSSASAQECTPRSMQLHSAAFSTTSSIASVGRCTGRSQFLHPTAAAIVVKLEEEGSEGRLASSGPQRMLLAKRSPAPLATTITPHRIWNQPAAMKTGVISYTETNGAMKREDNDDDDDEECYSQASEESPLLRASQGSSATLPKYIARLEEERERSLDASTLPTSPQVNPLKRERQDDLLPSLAHIAPICCLSQRVKRQRRHRKPHHEPTPPPSSSSSSSSAASLTSDAQDEDAATVLLSLARTEIPTVEGMPFPSSANDTASPSSPLSLRALPKNMPIKADIFPRLYQRFHLPRSLGEEDNSHDNDIVIRDSLKSCSAGEEARRIAGVIASGGTYHESSTPFDLYSPRWVRGVGRGKEGLCPICFHEGKGQGQGQEQGQGQGGNDESGGEDNESGAVADPHIKWKRIKTSEYNYHLINQHGISPHTLLPFDPPTAFRERHVTAAAKGQRSSFIQGKCHACKKFIDMQGKYVGPVKVPEIYWWKHARRCHKGKLGCSNGKTGVFVEDEVSKVGGLKTRRGLLPDGHLVILCWPLKYYRRVKAGAAEAQRLKTR